MRCFLSLDLIHRIHFIFILGEEQNVPTLSVSARQIMPSFNLLVDLLVENSQFAKLRFFIPSLV